MHLPETDALFGYACAVMRPQWNGDPISALQEALVISYTPSSLIFLSLAALALWRRTLWAALPLCLSWTAWALHILYDAVMYEPLITAQKVGCIGPSYLYLAIGTAICATILAHTLRPRRP